MSKLLSKIRRKVESLATLRVKSKDAVSTHDSNSPSETTDPCCYWCSRIKLREGPCNPSSGERKWLQRLFHSECECRRGANAPPSSACGFCKHLNIRHLVHCAFTLDNLRFPTILSDWYCRENPQNGCRLCQYIASYGSLGPEIGLDIDDCGPLWPLHLRLRGTDNGDDCISLSLGSVPQLQEHVSWPQVRRWLTKMHPRERNLPDEFRVIDVERNCIVALDCSVDYVTLSYVWGDSSQKEKPFQANMRNIKDLEIEGSLSEAPLPRTITDAMEVCRQLNQKYLWVDRLCVIQDDESKHDQINRMDSIFGSSEFTIIALSGQDANYGLPGVSKPRQSRRLTIFEWQGIAFTNAFPDIHNLVESSYWAKRGWTFQEEFCSRSNLYFTECGVYHSSSDDNTSNTECIAESILKPTQYFEFPDSVEAYAARSFTDPGDLLRAFTGVLNMEFDHHHFGNGAPRTIGWRTMFYEWIHWQPVDWEYEARRPPKDISTEPISHIQPHKSDVFPSWSWTSVQGGVHFCRPGESLALWAFPIAQGSQGINVEWVSSNLEAKKLRENIVEGGLMEAWEFPFQPTNGRELGSELISASSTLFEKSDRDEACKKLGRILSYTQIASLRLVSLDDHFCYDGRSRFQIMSSTGECMGGIQLPKLSLKYTFNRDGSLKEKEFEFMSLSASWEDDWEVERFFNGIGLEYGKHRLKVLNVMMIWHATDANVARRLGIGHVFKDQWFKERPVLKTVILE